MFFRTSGPREKGASAPRSLAVTEVAAVRGERRALLAARAVGVLRADLELAARAVRTADRAADVEAALELRRAELAVDLLGVDGGRARRNTGIGLGLPLARRLATSLGGELSIVAQPNGGTLVTFSVLLSAAN